MKKLKAGNEAKVDEGCGTPPTSAATKDSTDDFSIGDCHITEQHLKRSNNSSTVHSQLTEHKSKQAKGSRSFPTSGQTSKHNRILIQKLISKFNENCSCKKIHKFKDLVTNGAFYVTGTNVLPDKPTYRILILNVEGNYKKCWCIKDLDMLFTQEYQVILHDPKFRHLEFIYNDDSTIELKNIAFY